MSEHAATKKCPSAECKQGSSIIAVRLADGDMGYTRSEVPVSPTLERALHAQPRARRHLRFAAECSTTRCAHWHQDQCGVVKSVLCQLSAPVRAPLPPCSVRPECRWFHQAGKQACAVCAKVDRVVVV